MGVVMKYHVIEKNNKKFIEIVSDNLCICSAADALDIIVSAGEMDSNSFLS